MVKVKLKYLQHLKVKGHDYYYFRRQGSSIRLPHPNDPGFAAAYAKLIQERPKQQESGYGSMAWLVKNYRKSPKFCERKPSTRRRREPFLEMIVDEHGSRLAANLRRSDVLEMRDRLSETPATAAIYISTLSILMNHAIDMDLREVNPAQGVARLGLGEHVKWPDDVWLRAIDAASPMLRLALFTLRYSAQRVGDVCRMTRPQIDATGRLDLVQQKTGKPVSVPIHSSWAAEIAKVPRSDTAITLLYNDWGRPFTADTLQRRWRDLRAEIGAEGYVLHGLRKNACVSFAEAGATTFQISAITGQCLKIVEGYCKDANRELLADQALVRLEEKDRGDHAVVLFEKRDGNGKC